MSLYGQINGLKQNVLSRLRRLGRRNVKSDPILSYDTARDLTTLSCEIGRQIGLLISREKEICAVLIGSNRGLMIPDLVLFRPITRGLRGIRLIHTHLKNEPLSQEDLTDLALLRLDVMVAVGVLPGGLPGNVYIAHLLPANLAGKIHEILSPVPIHQITPSFAEQIETIIAEWDREDAPRATGDLRERVLLISVSSEDRLSQEESLEELAELARSANLNPIEKVVQRPKSLHPKTLLGSGKLKEVIMQGLQNRADMLIFNQNLTPLQIKAMGEITEMKVLDRTQLILDIFALHAVTREAQVQVELAQLRYRLPRLSERSTALSRLTGGIGGRGPGETRLEVDRRRTRDRITRLEQECVSLAQGRTQRRTRRMAQGIPILSIVGYTNAGKSTLLNLLTRSDIKTEDRLFSTLDTSTRRLFLPCGKEALLTDTVGFIHALPPDLIGAFASTLDELKDAHLLIHLVDLHTPSFLKQISDVEAVLNDLEVADTPQILVFNKVDLMDSEHADHLCQQHGAIGLSALDRKTVTPLLMAIERQVMEHTGHSARRGAESQNPYPTSSKKAFSSRGER